MSVHDVLHVAARDDMERPVHGGKVATGSYMLAGGLSRYGVGGP